MSVENRLIDAKRDGAGEGMERVIGVNRCEL